MYLGMALRVLLADESSTIKKAIQMALSDLGVDVKSVPSGLDVLAVSRTFDPQLILADVLLTKKNGYEVCAEIKADHDLKHTPVILMWSSFMQLDQTQFHKVKADASLEKPFDSETLRALVEKFVPQTKEFPLRGLLNHPDLPDFEESDSFVRGRNATIAAQTPSASEPTSPTTTNPEIKTLETQIYKTQSSALSNQDALDEIDDFAEMPLKSKKTTQIDDWTSATTGEHFHLETESYGDFEEVTVMTTEQDSVTTPNLQQRIKEQLDTYIQDTPVTKNKSQTSPVRNMTTLDEQIMKEEVRMMAEKICWQILPEITEKIVREELHKLLIGLEKT